MTRKKYLKKNKNNLIESIEKKLKNVMEFN